MVIPALIVVLDTNSREIEVNAPLYLQGHNTEVNTEEMFLLVSFEKGFSIEIANFTVSNWIKHTMKLCYERSDKSSLKLAHV